MTARQVIAVCGKGGVGKTAYTAMLTRVLASRPNNRLLVVDADPALGLNYALGRESEKTIGSIRDEVIHTAEKGGRDDLKAMADKIDYLVAKAIEERDDYAFMAMGRMDGIGCFCSINELLKEALAEVSDSFDTILIDGEAGLEQINRQVVDSIDTLILVTDTSLRGMKTVKHIKGLLAEGLIPSCRKVGVVFNRAQSDVEPLIKFASEIGVEVLGFVPYDKTVEEFDLNGKSLFGLPEDNPALKVVAATFAKASE